MPLYEYDCAGCGVVFEKLVRNASKADEMVCPQCGSKHTSRKFSTFAVSGRSSSRSSVSSASSAASCAPTGL